MEEVSLKEFCAWIGVSGGPFAAGRFVRGVSTDSRVLRPGEIFFCLRGPRYDGHLFARQALRKGAVAVVAERRIPFSGRVLRVPSVREALARAACEYRMRTNAEVIGVTGSNGKSTVKEMLARILETAAGRSAVAASAASHNNEIGVPLTVFRMDRRTKYAVVELGANHVGEIANLCRICRPTVGLITSIGYAHLGPFGGYKGVLKAKSELLAALPQNAPAVLPAAHARRLLEASGRRDLRVVRFRHRRGDPPLQMNMAAARAAAKALGIPSGKTEAGLARFRPLPGRMNRLRGRRWVVYDDAYNANPSSLKAALAEFGRIAPSPRRVVILGDMRELGAYSGRWHRIAGRWLARLKPRLAILIGREIAAAAGPLSAAGVRFLRFRSADSLIAGGAPLIRRHLQSGDHVLVKASHAMNLSCLARALAGGN